MMKGRGLVGSLSAIATRWFPALVLGAAVLGYLFPSGSALFAPAIVWLLGVVMLGMGMTLRPADFAPLLKRPLVALTGIAAQYAVMPVVAWALCLAFALPPPVMVGVLLVGCSPGGTSSNVITYLAKGDVALSVAMTSLSTLLAIMVTPALMLVLADARVPVDAAAMMLTVLKIVLAPVLLGFVLRLAFERQVERLLVALPVLSVTAIVVIVGAVVGLNAGRLLSTAGWVLLVVAIHNTTGLALGYGFAKIARGNLAQRRAVSIEVGMQNSGMAVALAAKHFADPAAMLAGAVFSVWQNISGPILASWWRRDST